MSRFEFDGVEARLYLAEDDMLVLDSLAQQLIDLVSDGLPEQAAADGDPFALWEADLSESPDEPEVPEDPALQRLFPNPYPHDPQAASDHRRFTLSDGRRRKIADAEVVRAAVATHRAPIRIPVAEVPAWLKSTNAMRLIIATRMGVDDDDAMESLHEIPDGDPRAMGAYLMDFLAELQMVIIELTSA